MAAKYGLFEEDGVFWFYVDTLQASMSYNLLTVLTPTPVGHGFNYSSHIYLITSIRRMFAYHLITLISACTS